MESRVPTDPQATGITRTEEEVSRIFDVSAENELGKIIKVIGVGGAGGNAANFVFKKDLPFVEVGAYNTDQQDLNTLSVERKYLIGPKVTAQMGAGRKPELGREAMVESSELLEEFLLNPHDSEDSMTQSRFAFILGGLGGGTASGAVPVVAKMCRDAGYITIAVLTIPPRHHGATAMEIALKALELAEQEVDKLILIDNEKIYSRLPQEKKSTVFRIIDEKIADAIESFVHIISRVPRENVDPNDIRTILTNSSSKLAVIGTGEGSRAAEIDAADSEKPFARIKQALDNAILSPILLYNSIVYATDFLTHIVCNPADSLATFEDRAIADSIAARARCNGRPSILSGGGEDPSIPEGNVQITIIATGFKNLLPSLIVKRIVQNESNQTAHTPLSATDGMNEDDQLIARIMEDDPTTNTTSGPDPETPSLLFPEPPKTNPTIPQPPSQPNRIRTKRAPNTPPPAEPSEGSTAMDRILQGL